MINFVAMVSLAEENYLKAIFSLNQKNKGGATTNAIAERLATKASSVTDMLKKLSDKKLVNYQKYKAVSLSEEGRKIAVNVLRKHRLWEYFLVEKLKYGWDEVHEIAEQLEHIHSTDLIDRLDAFLDYPRHDPHGDPIPDKDGNFLKSDKKILIELEKGEMATIVGVREHSSPFLQYLDTMQLQLGTQIELINRHEFDQSMQIKLKNLGEVTISQEVSKNLYVSIISS